MSKRTFILATLIISAWGALMFGAFMLEMKQLSIEETRIHCEVTHL